MRNESCRGTVRGFSPVALFAVAVILVNAGCSTTQQTNEELYSKSPNFEARHPLPFVFGVHDQREYVLNGKKSERFFGTAISFGAIPRDRNCRSGNTTAGATSTFLVNGFKKHGAEPLQIFLKAGDKSVAMDEFKKVNNRPRGLLVTIHELKHAWAYVHVKYDYDFEAEVFDSSGSLLAQNRKAGQLTYSVNNGPEADRLINSVYEQLLNDSKIIAALEQ